MDEFLQQITDPQANGLYWAQKEEFYPMKPAPKSYEEERKRQKLWLAKPGDFTSANEQQTFVRDIQKSEFAKTNWPTFANAVPVVLKEKKQEAQSMAYTDVRTHSIYVAPDGSGRLRITSLHELAHVIAVYEGLEDQHGPHYVGIFRKLIAQYFPAHVASFDRRLRKWHVTWK